MSFVLMEAGSAVRDELRERLLRTMDRKHHGAFVHLTRPGLSREQLKAHFRHEYQVYVRDFPVLLARVLGQGPPDDVRAALAENLFEEQTGKLSVGRPHPELFLTMMGGLGFSRADLESSDPPLEREAVEYRDFLDRTSASAPWQVGCAILTIFVEGSVHERAEIEGRRVRPSAEEAIARHPMVLHYGCPPETMLLARAHGAVEGDHRRDAWRSVLDHVSDRSLADRVAEGVETALEGWLRYRDAVARAMGVRVLSGPQAAVA